MSAGKRALSIVFDETLGATETLDLPRTQHADNFTTDFSRADHEDYSTFDGTVTYTSTERAWSGQDISVSFNGYFDTPGEIWSHRFTVEAANGGHITVTASKGNEVLLYFALDHTSDLIDLLGAKARGNSSANVLTGGLVHDTLQGFGGNDTINGRSGNDLIGGGAGKDDLTGGLGSDTFYFSKVTDSGVPSSTRDTIQDFEASDTIDLRRIDANTELSGNNRFYWIDGHRYSGHAGELRYSKGVLTADVDGDKHSDFAVTIANHFTLHSDDFIL